MTSYFNAWQGDGNRQTLGRTGCVVLMTWSCRKWRKITHVLRRKNSWTYLKTCKNGKNTTGRINGISAVETKHPKFAEKQVNGNGNLTWIELRMFQLVFKLWIQVSELCRKTTPNKQVTWRKTVWNGHELSPAGYTEKASTEPKFTYWVKWFLLHLCLYFYVLASILNFSNKVFSSFTICRTESDLCKARLAPIGPLVPLHDVAVSPASSAVTAACFFSLASVLNFTNISKISLLFKYLPKWLEIWNVENPERLFDNYKCPTLGTSNLPIRPTGMSLFSPRNWLI